MIITIVDVVLEIFYTYKHINNLIILPGFELYSSANWCCMKSSLKLHLAFWHEYKFLCRCIEIETVDTSQVTSSSSKKWELFETWDVKSENADAKALFRIDRTDRGQMHFFPIQPSYRAESIWNCKNVILFLALLILILPKLRYISI